jgi:hypothetical protein
VSTRRRIEDPQTVTLHPIELTALLQPSGGGEKFDAAGQTVEMLPMIDPEPDAELPTTKMIRIAGAPGPARPTLSIRRLASSSAPQPVLARVSEPVPSPRGTRRSREMLRVDDVKPPAAGSAGPGGKPRLRG